jgi:hypothetical protein
MGVQGIAPAAKMSPAKAKTNGRRGFDGDGEMTEVDERCSGEMRTLNKGKKTAEGPACLFLSVSVQSAEVSWWLSG